MSWSFTITPANGPFPPLLQRTTRVKWWDKLPKYQIEKMTYSRRSRPISRCKSLGTQYKASSIIEDDEGTSSFQKMHGPQQ
ncbi:hypothetical protein L6452_08312 [Arctium lappa]|uniref:Uncharacterized protein n=1 Tax=Arctium lappa TaxID=4217 RepID=A0ACB9DI11_ARCLA|nr:hypothetical protein L6452_08312 [Arctium lappa]